MENPNGLASQKTQVKNEKIQGSTCSLSVPSEPLNVGNWFSSYEYESPALGTIDGFRDSVSRENEVFVIQENPEEKEKQMDKFQKNICKEETKSNGFANNVQENQSLSEIPDSSFCPSQVSEASDVRNWFSSYVYDSFVLDTNDDVKDTVHEESGCDEEGVVVGESQKEQEENLADNKNCFSSYAYESFVLDTDDDDKGTACLESECDKGGGVVGGSQKELEENLAHLRNRFSSYAYESFVLDTNDDVKGTVCHESECDKEGFAMGKDHREHEKNMDAFREIGICIEMDVGRETCPNGFVKSGGSLGEDELDDKSLCKNLDSSDSPSVFTEPPDVKNWFSSYAYESPALDTRDPFGDSLHLEREGEKFVVEDSEGENEEKLGIIRKVKRRGEKFDKEKVQSNRLGKHNCYLGVHEQAKVSKRVQGTREEESLSPQSNLCSVKAFKGSSEARTLQINGTNASKDVKESKYSDEDSISKLGQEFSQEAYSVSLNRKKSPTKLFHRTVFKKESMEDDANFASPSSNSKSASARGASQRYPNHGSGDKENEPKGSTENGYVATRKINGCARTGNGDSSKRPRGILLECHWNKGSVSPAGENDPFIRRKALMERTDYPSSDALEVTGKWRCPQRSKPNVGPPLKQLRLERWIHRV